MRLYIRLLVLIISLFIQACSSQTGDDNNVGWVTITQPTTSSTYTVADTYSITLAGETFISPNASKKYNKICNCYSLVECANKQRDGTLSCYYSPYYDSAVTVMVNNQTTGTSISQHITSVIDYSKNWSTSIPLVNNENVIEVRSEDESGNWGTAQIKINVVDSKAPAVTSIQPDNSAAAPINSKIIITFSEPMDTSTIISSSFIVSDGVNNISGNISFSNNATVATFVASSNLSYNSTYTITLTNAIKDLVGNSLTQTSSSFSTISFQQTQPSGLKASGDDGLVSLIWNFVPDADYYNLYYGTNPDITTANGTLISGITSLTYTHTGLTNGNDYYYIVTAENTIDGESMASAVTSATAGMVVKQFITTSYDYGRSIAVDTNGNSYVTGSTSGDLVGTGNVGGSGNDIFIAKYDASGNPLWIKQLGSAESASANGIAIDASGNSYITGETYGDLTGNGFAGGVDVFIAKLDTLGDPLWIKQAGTSTNEYGNDIVVDSNGNSYITGHTNGDLAGTGNAGGRDIFIAKYDASGNQNWIKQLGTAYDDTAYSVGIDSSGNSYG
ncbi:MAG: SBBP repeat-containing protein [Gammaproteobacteria bacterium]